MFGSEASIALWGRNIFDNKSPQFVQNITSLFIAASFEKARTYGLDFTVKF